MTGTVMTLGRVVIVASVCVLLIQDIRKGGAR